VVGERADRQRRGQRRRRRELASGQLHENDSAAWSRWSVPWPATPGVHEVRARATDAAGTTQPTAVPFNDGGYAFWAVVSTRFSLPEGDRSLRSLGYVGETRSPAHEDFFEPVDWTACPLTPTSRSSPNSEARSPRHGRGGCGVTIALPSAHVSESAQLQLFSRHGVLARPSVCRPWSTHAYILLVSCLRLLGRPPVEG
jgi:hypothetical protein